MKKILIIEDEEPLINALYDKFTGSGFEVIKAKDGQEGYASAIKFHPDLILLDIIMPVMDGMSMLEKLRLDPWGKDVKVILLTNLSDPGKIKQSLGKGVRDYLIKSDWKLEDIVKKVREKLDIPTS